MIGVIVFGAPAVVKFACTYDSIVGVAVPSDPEGTNFCNLLSFYRSIVRIVTLAGRWGQRPLQQT
jgi:hypothetical protein